jgi:hypothetical protein
MARSVSAALLLACALSFPFAMPAHAELPPWVYGDRQRQAPVVVQVVVERVGPRADGMLARCRVLKVVRQPRQGQLKAGQVVHLLYSLPNKQPMMVGPSALPALRPGETITAWLRARPGEVGSFEPAAGGKSFGPFMEDSVEPGAQNP